MLRPCTPKEMKCGEMFGCFSTIVVLVIIVGQPQSYDPHFQHSLKASHKLMGNLKRMDMIAVAPCHIPTRKVFVCGSFQEEGQWRNAASFTPSPTILALHQLLMYSLIPSLIQLQLFACQLAREGRFLMLRASFL